MMGFKREEIISMSKKWNVIYPAYLNSTLSESEGPRKKILFFSQFFIKRQKNRKKKMC